jgi:hypothetical protein
MKVRFNVFFIDEYIPTLDHCGTFTVPTPYGIGDFYTASRRAIRKEELY